MAKIKEIAIKNPTGGTYDNRDIGAEAQNIDVSYDSNGQIIEDIKASGVTVASTKTLPKALKDIKVDKSIKDLTDTNISASPSNGQGLIYNSSNGKWENKTIESGAQTLSGLTDTNISSPSAGQILTYQSGKWVNGASATGDFMNKDGSNASSSVNMSSTSSFRVGNNNIANGSYSQAFGSGSKAYGNYSHTEGQNTCAVGYSSHAEGEQTRAVGNYSHAEGQNTCAVGLSSHAEGTNTYAGSKAHSEGTGTCAKSENSHAEGFQTCAMATGAHAEGVATCVTNYGAHAEGYNTCATNIAAHAEGLNTYAAGTYSHAEGSGTCAVGTSSHAEGSGTCALESNTHAEGYNTCASAYRAHAEGHTTCALSDSSHAEGLKTYASGVYAHAEGCKTQATQESAHAEGNSTCALGISSHAEGEQTRAVGYASHVEGYQTCASGSYSHAEGNSTCASSLYAHAEGYQTCATNDYSHVGGNKVNTQNDYEFVHGNEINTNTYHSGTWTGVHPRTSPARPPIERYTYESTSSFTEGEVDEQIAIFGNGNNIPFTTNGCSNGFVAISNTGNIYSSGMRFKTRGILDGVKVDNCLNRIYLPKGSVHWLVSNAYKLDTNGTYVGTNSYLITTNGGGASTSALAVPKASAFGAGGTAGVTLKLGASSVTEVEAYDFHNTANLTNGNFIGWITIGAASTAYYVEYALIPILMPFDDFATKKS